VPSAALSAGSVDVRLHLTGSPSRETDYLVVYSSSVSGGMVLIDAAEVEQGATVCASAG
jgi:hypothetical protein